MKNAGQYVFRCEADNSIQGIGKSNDTILTVDGELLQFCCIVIVMDYFQCPFVRSVPNKLAKRSYQGEKRILPEQVILM